MITRTDYLNRDPSFKERRITQLAEMAKDPEKLAEELEAMTEILFDVERRASTDEIKVIAGMMADMAAVLTIQQYLALEQARKGSGNESQDQASGD